MCTMSGLTRARLPTNDAKLKKVHPIWYNRILFLLQKMKPFCHTHMFIAELLHKLKFRIKLNIVKCIETNLTVKSKILREKVWC